MRSKFAFVFQQNIQTALRRNSVALQKTTVYGSGTARLVGNHDKYAIKNKCGAVKTQKKEDLTVFLLFI